MPAFRHRISFLTFLWKKSPKIFGTIIFSAYLCNRYHKKRWTFSSAGLEYLSDRQRVDGSNPPTSTKGCFPEWPNGADCKSAVFRLRWFESISTHENHRKSDGFFLPWREKWLAMPSFAICVMHERRPRSNETATMKGIAFEQPPSCSACNCYGINRKMLSVEINKPLVLGSVSRGKSGAQSGGRRPGRCIAPNAPTRSSCRC